MAEFLRIAGLQLTLSDWKFMNSGSSGVSLGFGAAETGMITLDDPKQNSVKLSYIVGGGGVSVGFKVPKLKIKVPHGFLTALAKLSKSKSAASDSHLFTGHGRIFGINRLKALTASDFTGPCMMLEAGLSAGAGASVYATLCKVNIPQSLMDTASDTRFVLPAPMLEPVLSADLAWHLIKSSRVLMLSGGGHLAIQCGLGGQFLTGTMRLA